MFPGKGKSKIAFPQNYTLLDIETTDLDLQLANLIEVAALKVRNDKIVDKYVSLVRPPDGYIPEFISDLTGITKEMVENAPSAQMVLPQLKQFLEGDIIIGHNVVGYDGNVLCNHYAKYCNELFPNDYVDTYRLARRILKDLPHHRLSDIAAFYGMEHNNGHRAERDCLTTYQCYYKLQTSACEQFGSLDNFLAFANKKKQGTGISYTPETLALRELKNLAEEIIADDMATVEEIHKIYHWVNNNMQLAGNHLFDNIQTLCQQIMSDHIITPDEQSEILELLSDFVDPVENLSVCCQVIFPNKIFCLTGEFETGNKEEIKEKIVAKGGICKDSVVKKTNYLIVGGVGNSNWKFGNYGAKVSKALEMQEKGFPIQILKEMDFIHCLNS